jgi:hypothetical protein
MAKQSLASMPLNALVKLRESVSAIISRRTDALKKELRAIGEDYKEVGRIAIYGKKKAKKRKAGREPGREAAPKARRKTGRKAVAKTRRPNTAKRSAGKRKARA